MFVCVVCSLHYTTVTLGTPGMKFLVALDTGSDLFWVPCDCTRCAPIQSSTYGSVSFHFLYNSKLFSILRPCVCHNSSFEMHTL